MDYDKLFEIIKNLEFDTNRVITKTEGEEIYVLRPSKVSKRFKDYDAKKNFQIWLKEKDGQEFRPNHLRVMIDLNLRVRSRPELKKDLFVAFDNIFYHKDPENELKTLRKEKFEHSLNHIDIIATLSQLFIIEQEYNYHKESKYIPPTLFYQGWVRAFIDGAKQIDNLSLSMGARQPPLSKYTERENKKSKRYEEGLKALWYLD